MSEHKITYDVCKAHDNMQDLVKDGTKQAVLRFLRKQNKPFDFDVRSCYWDGVNCELSCHVTGDDFLDDPNQLDYVLESAINKATSINKP